MNLLTPAYTFRRCWEPGAMSLGTVQQSSKQKAGSRGWMGDSGFPRRRRRRVAEQGQAEVYEADSAGLCHCGDESGERPWKRLHPLGQSALPQRQAPNA